MNDPIVKELFAKLAETQQNLFEHPAPDFPSYRERVGYYNGLKEAVNIVVALLQEDDNRDF